MANNHRSAAFFQSHLPLGVTERKWDFNLRADVRSPARDSIPSGSGAEGHAAPACPPEFSGLAVNVKEVVH
jgi:hypothetical protein